MDKAPNYFFKPNFVKDIGKNLMPTAPLWSAILLNDMSQHGTSKSYQEYKRKRLLTSTSLVERCRTLLGENRMICGLERCMGFLYELQINASREIRINDFSGNAY